MDTQLLSSPTVILCSSTKSEQNLGLVTSPAHSAGSPRQPFLGPTSCTQDWFSGLCSGPRAVLADEQGQSQKPMHLSLNQSHFFFRREGGRMQSCSSQKKVGVSLCWVRMDGWRQTGHGSSKKAPGELCHECQLSLGQEQPWQSQHSRQRDTAVHCLC